MFTRLYLGGLYTHLLLLQPLVSVFVKIKDGGLYSLPLLPVALEQLRGATIFTKLDLLSAYNLVRIQKGDEWKTVFTSRGQYKYLIMLFGLSNAPSVSQAFINNVLKTC